MSYTTEDMCEINSHGGNVIMRKILQICLKNGADLAEPGEFTKRAFLNGRIDLSQAESVIDIINAKSDREAKEGIKQLEGYLATSIRQIKNEILDVNKDKIDEWDELIRQYKIAISELGSYNGTLLSEYIGTEYSMELRDKFKVDTDKLIDDWAEINEKVENILGGIRNADRTVTKRNDSGNESKR